MGLTEHSTQHQQNTYSLKVHMKHSPGHKLGHKTSLSKFKNTEIISSIFPKHSDIKQKSVTEGKLENPNTWILNNTLLNNQSSQKRNQKIS